MAPKRMDPGSLRHRMELMKPSVVPDDMGGHSEVWTPVTALWAAIEPISAKEIERADAREIDVTHRITTRFRDDLTAAMRLVMGDRAFVIGSVLDPDESRRYLQMTVREVAAP